MKVKRTLDFGGDAYQMMLDGYRVTWHRISGNLRAAGHSGLGTGAIIANGQTHQIAIRHWRLNRW